MECKKCSDNFEILDEDRKFYEKLDVPEPTHCPVCRLKRRMMWRNVKKILKLVTNQEDLKKYIAKNVI